MGNGWRQQSQKGLELCSFRHQLTNTNVCNKQAEIDIDMYDLRLYITHTLREHHEFLNNAQCTKSTGFKSHLFLFNPLRSIIGLIVSRQFEKSLPKQLHWKEVTSQSNAIKIDQWYFSKDWKNNDATLTLQLVSDHVVEGSDHPENWAFLMTDTTKIWDNDKKLTLNRENAADKYLPSAAVAQ